MVSQKRKKKCCSKVQKAIITHRLQYNSPQRRCNNETDDTQAIKVQPMGCWDIQNVFKEECVQFYNLENTGTLVRETLHKKKIDI